MSAAKRGSVHPSKAALARLGIKPYNLERVRPKLKKAANFAEASSIPTSTSTKPSTSRKLSTSTPCSGSFSKRRTSQLGQIQLGSVPFLQRRKPSKMNVRLLVELIMILCSLPIIETNAAAKSKLVFHLL